MSKCHRIIFIYSQFLYRETVIFPDNRHKQQEQWSLKMICNFWNFDNNLVETVNSKYDEHCSIEPNEGDYTTYSSF